MKICFTQLWLPVGQGNSCRFVWYVVNKVAHVNAFVNIHCLHYLIFN